MSLHACLIALSVVVPASLRVHVPVHVGVEPVALSAPLATGAQTDAAVARLAAAEREAAHAMVFDRVEEALVGLADAVRSAAARLAALPVEEGGELADEIEFAIVRMQECASATFDRSVVGRLLEGVAIDPVHGAAFAQLQWKRDGGAYTLHPLVTWEFVGPFDNERGQGLTRRLPPADQPAAATYRGKVRDVAWRTTPATPPMNGVVDLGALVHPSEQVGVLARSWLASSGPSQLLLHLGFADEVRVWLRGELVFEALGNFEFAPDAFAIPLALADGWNEVCVLVGSRDGSPRFSARLTDVEHARPVQLEQVASAPSGHAPLTLSDARGTLAANVSVGVRARVARADDATSALRRAVLARLFPTVPSSRNPGREEAAQAVELAPTDVVALMERATSLEGSGSQNERDANPWLHAVDAVLAVEPKSPWAWRQRAVHSGWNQNARVPALEHLARALAANPTSVPALSTKLALLDGAGHEAEAQALRLALLALPPARLFPYVRSQAVSVLAPLDPLRLEVARSVVAASRGLDGVNIVELFERRGGAPVTADDIERSARARLARDPWNVNVHVAAARQLIATGECDRALRWLDDALALAPEWPEIEKWRARAFLARDDTELAVVALEHEVELDFAAEDERRLLEHLRTLGAEPFQVHYQEPLLDILARHPLPVEGRTGTATNSREVLLSRVVVDVQPDGTAKTYRRLVQRVLTESGARDLDRVPFGSAANQEVRVLAANVVRADGSVAAARTGRSTRGLVVDLPPLSVGDVVDLEWRVDDTHTTFFGNYFGFSESLAPDMSVPTLESEIVLRVPDELPLTSHLRGGIGEAQTATLADGRTELRWRATDLEPVAPEPYMPPAREFAPLVQASSYPSWEAFGAWWWKLIEQEIDVSPEMSAKVAELVAGHTSKLEQLRAIYEFVVTDIRYNAWEFGVRGYQPYSAPVIYSRGFGDCKDKAILLRAMLSKAGIECYPVLLLAEDRRFEEDHTLALVEHFNHCIAYVPAQGDIPAMFLDGTARHHALGLLPTMDDGAKALVVRPEGVAELVVPRSTADQNRAHSEYDVTLSSSREAQVAVTRRSFGRFDPADRANYTGTADERNEAVTRLLTGLLGPLAGGAEATFSDLDDLSAPVVITAHCEATQLARETENGFELPASLGRMDLLRSLASRTERKTDLLLDVPMSIFSVVRYTLPPGAVAGEPPPPVELTCPDARYTWRAQRTPTGFVVEEMFALEDARIAAERYGAFREFARRVDETQSAVLEVEVPQ